jgi:glutamyl-tRNA reductase
MTGNSTNILLAGTSHRLSTVSERSLLQLDRKEIPVCLKFLKSYADVQGAIVISTCNRIEFYIASDTKNGIFEIISRLYKENRNFDISGMRHLFYEYEGSLVTEHLFRVVSGLDSLVLGEYQIQGQVKEAYSIACQSQSPEKHLHKLFHAAFRTGKRVRTETAIGEGRLSVGGVAAGIITRELKPEERVAIFGVNETTKIIAQKLSESGFHNFAFINRTHYKAEMMAELFGGNSYSIDDIDNALAGSKALFSCTGAKSYIVQAQNLIQLKERGACPGLIIDMAVPRDIDTRGIGQDVKIFDIGNLRLYMDRQDKKRADCIPAAERIIEEEISVFRAWSESNGNEVLQPYAEKFEIARLGLLNEYRDKFPDAYHESLDQMTHSLVHRLQSVFMKSLVSGSYKL